MLAPLPLALCPLLASHSVNATYVHVRVHVHDVLQTPGLLAHFAVVLRAVCGFVVRSVCVLCGKMHHCAQQRLATPQAIIFYGEMR